MKKDKKVQKPKKVQEVVEEEEQEEMVEDQEEMESYDENVSDDYSLNGEIPAETAENNENNKLTYDDDEFGNDNEYELDEEQQVFQFSNKEFQQGEQLQHQQLMGQDFDMQKINNKIQDILKILANLNELRDEGMSRTDYIKELVDSICLYYGYNKDLVLIFLQQFAPNELVQFLEANDQPRPMVIRTNTLKAKRKELAQILIQRGINLDPLAEWSKVGLVIYESKVPIGATPEYLAGQYMLQSASSFLPVMALAPQMNEKVLDMAAAPGGKTTYISQLMKNSGVVFANDVSAARIPALKFNLMRMGCLNTVVTNMDGRKYPKYMNGFDRVLLDAPCTGLGIISRDPAIKTQKTIKDVYKHAHLQKELLSAAIDCCKVGGYVVYSTCSVAIAENESVVDYALNNRFVKLVDTGLEIGEEGFTKHDEKKFDGSLKLAKRIYPHIHNMDGFFMVKLLKIKNGHKKEHKVVEQTPKKPKRQQRYFTKEQQQQESKQQPALTGKAKLEAKRIQKLKERKEKKKKNLFEKKKLRKQEKKLLKKNGEAVTQVKNEVKEQQNPVEQAKKKQNSNKSDKKNGDKLLTKRKLQKDVTDSNIKKVNKKQKVQKE